MKFSSILAAGALFAVAAASDNKEPLTITRVSPGDGKTFPKVGDTIKVHYTGTLADGGTKFDSSVDRDQPFQTKIGVGHVIKCWDDGMMKLSVGEKAILHCDSSIAYGSRGAGGLIPPNSNLDFEVQLLEILNDN